MELYNYNNENKKIKTLMNVLKVEHIIGNEDLLVKLKNIMEQAAEDLKIFENIKEEVVRIDRILKERMNTRTEYIKHLFDIIMGKSNE
jgi:hypothetical protein